jgi:hypothetical protein
MFYPWQDPRRKIGFRVSEGERDKWETERIRAELLEKQEAGVVHNEESDILTAFFLFCEAE